LWIGLFYLSLHTVQDPIKKPKGIMRTKSIEEIVVRNIENGIRGIKCGTKKPEDVNVVIQLKKLQAINDGLYEDLCDKYYSTLDEYRTKINENKSQKVW
jgi:hypothetical protein